MSQPASIGGGLSFACGDPYRLALQELEAKEDSTYDDLKRELLDDLQYQRRIRRIREERGDYDVQLEHGYP